MAVLSVWVLAGLFSPMPGKADEAAGYAGKLFDSNYVHIINIEISDEDWMDLKLHPTEKTKYHINITIDGETLEDVSFATKGNTSLTEVAKNPNSDRYSFKINFKKYVKGQTYYGLNKLNLSNIFADATYMKDFVSYEISREAGVDAPLTSYVWLTVNGEDFGLYLAIEDMSSGYLRRVKNGEGVLYKPATMSFEQSNDSQRTNGSPIRDKSAGASLLYSTDDLSAYSSIFDNAETDATEADMQRVVAALKGLASQEHLDAYLDTDEIIRYFVAHNFVLNYDSYTGSNLHNYFLYENGGRLQMLPWDYNLAFGGYTGGGPGNTHAISASELINWGIDAPLTNASLADRPMWSWIAESQEYLARYHQMYDELIQDYFESGRFEEEMEAIHDLIRPYVEKDPSAFYSPERFEQAYEALKIFCALRAESIRKQLNGSLATDYMKQNAADRLSADLDPAVMGTMFGNNGAGNSGGNQPGNPPGNIPGAFGSSDDVPTGGAPFKGAPQQPPQRQPRQP